MYKLLKLFQCIIYGYQKNICHHQCSTFKIPKQNIILMCQCNETMKFCHYLFENIFFSNTVMIWFLALLSSLIWFLIRHISDSNATDIPVIDGLTCFVCAFKEGSPAKELSDCTDIQKCQPGEVRFHYSFTQGFCVRIKVGFFFTFFIPFEWYIEKIWKD